MVDGSLNVEADIITQSVSAATVLKEPGTTMADIYLQSGHLVIMDSSKQHPATYGHMPREPKMIELGMYLKLYWESLYCLMHIL